jgi:predicted transcriptional regulator of viral defense system
VKRKKYFHSEGAFESIWQSANHDGIWNGDATSLAAEFGVTEDDAHSALSDLCDRRIIEKLYTGKYIIVNLRERDDADSTRHSISAA